VQLGESDEELKLSAFETVERNDKEESGE